MHQHRLVPGVARIRVVSQDADWRTCLWCGRYVPASRNSQAKVCSVKCGASYNSARYAGRLPADLGQHQSKRRG